MFYTQRDTFLRNCTSKRSIIVLLFFVLFSACQSEDRHLPDVDHLIPEIELVRFEQELFQLDTNDLAAGIAALEAKHPDFTAVFFRHIIPLRRGDFSPEEQELVLKAYLRYPLIQEIFKRSQAIDFGSRGGKWNDLRKSLAYFSYYFPEVPLPDTLLTFVSQFEFAGFLYGENQLALGLDMFLGPDFDYKSVSPNEPIFSDYLSRTYTPEHINAKLMQLLIEDNLPEPTNGRLLDYMIYNGKKLQLLDLVLPLTPDSIKLEMTAQQTQWLQENEAPIYVYLQSEELLYETDFKKFRKYIDPSPNSPGMPEEAPGRSANYIGWQIVSAWMKRHPDAKIQDLLAISDGQRILAESRYKPN